MDRRLTAAISRDAKAEALAAREGITVLQAIRKLQAREFAARNPIRRTYQ